VGNPVPDVGHMRPCAS